MRVSTLVLAFGAVVAFGLPQASRADCTDGHRALKPAEKAFYGRVTSLRGAFPKAPKGWQRDGKLEQIPRMACVGGREPLQAELRVAYLNRARVKQGAKGMEETGEDVTATRQKRFAALMARFQTLQTQMANAKDPATRARLQKQNAALQKQMQHFASATDASLDEAERPHTRDMVAVVDLVAGGPAFTVGCTKVDPLHLPGATRAYRFHCARRVASDHGQERADGFTLALVGAWKVKRTDDGMTFTPAHPVAAPAAPHYAVVEVKADASRATALVHAMDLPAVAAAVRP